MGLPLLVIGDGPDARRLKRLAGPTVRFAGRATDEAVARMLASARALVVTATEEFGIAAVEAQAAGRPVIALRARRRRRDAGRRAHRRLLRPLHARGAGGGRARLRRPGDRPRGVRRQRARASRPRASSTASRPSSSRRSPRSTSGSPGASRAVAGAAWPAPREARGGRGRAAARRRRAVGVHDHPRLPAPRRGADARVGASDRRRASGPTATSGSTTGPASRCCSPAW